MIDQSLMLHWWLSTNSSEVEYWSEFSTDTKTILIFEEYKHVFLTKHLKKPNFSNDNCSTQTLNKILSKNGKNYGLNLTSHLISWWGLRDAVEMSKKRKQVDPRLGLSSKYCSQGQKFTFTLTNLIKKYFFYYICCHWMFHSQQDYETFNCSFE